MEINKIYFGECIEIMRDKISEKSIDLVFADPPYNLSGNGLKLLGNKTGGDWFMVNEGWDKMEEKEYFEFSLNWITLAMRSLKDTGSIYISCTYHNIAELLTILKKLNVKVNNIITWYKTNAMPSLTKRTFTHSTEFVIWGVKGKNWVFNYEELKKINPEKQIDGSLKQMRDVWAIPITQGKERLKANNGRALHPTQKPIELLKRIVVASSKVGDIVLDPFLGSGTTSFVAALLNRNYIGIENNEVYFNAAIDRMEQLKSNIFLRQNFF